jgi:hypothetical protein
MITGGEVQGERRFQELTTVLLHPVSRAVMVGRVDLDENPRWRQRGHCRRRGSGGQRR